MCVCVCVRVRVCVCVYEFDREGERRVRANEKEREDDKNFQQNQNQLPAQEFLCTPDVNFTNILRPTFMYENSRRSFCVLTFRCKLFWAQKFWCKCAHKLLVKLTQAVVCGTILIVMEESKVAQAVKV